MALTRAGLLRVGTASTTGAIQVGAGLSITSDGVLSGSGAVTGDVVNQIIAGAGISISPSSGIGTLTISLASGQPFPGTNIDIPSSFPVSDGTVWASPSSNIFATGCLEISLDNITFTQDAFVIQPGDTLYVRWINSGSCIGAPQGTVITGTISDGQYVQSASLTINRIPNAFTLDDLSSQGLSTTITSNPSFLTGLTAPAYVTIVPGATLSNVQASIGSTAFVGIPTTGTTLIINPNQSIQLRGDTGPTNNTTYSASIQVGDSVAGVTTDTWNVTTVAVAAAIAQPSITAPPNGSANLNPAVNTPPGITLTGSTYTPLNGAGAQTSSEWEVYEAIPQQPETSAITNVSTSPGGTSWTVTDWTSIFSGGNVRDVQYLNGQWFAVGDGGKIATSPDGVTWTNRTTSFGSNTQWFGVAYANSTYLVAGSNGALATSSDGVTWTSRTAPGGSSYSFRLTSSPTLFVAAGGTSTNTGAFTSPDGINWTPRSTGWGTGGFDYVIAVSYGNGLFVLGGKSGGNARLVTSPDGITWTPRASGFGTGDIATSSYGNGLHIIAGGNRVATSANGISWSSTTIATGSIPSVAAGGGLFVATYTSPAGGVYTSSDGSTWSPVIETGATVTFQAVGYGDNLFIAGGGNNTTSQQASSVASLTNLTFTDATNLANMAADDSVVEIGGGGDASGTIGSIDVAGPTITLSASSGTWNVGATVQDTTAPTVIPPAPTTTPPNPSEYTAITGSPFTDTSAPFNTLLIPQSSLETSSTYYSRVQYATTNSQAATSPFSAWSSFGTVASFAIPPGTPLGGGYFAGQINVSGTIYNLIVAPVTGTGGQQGQYGGVTPQEIQYKTTTSADDGATLDQAYGGLATTNFADGNHPMFNWCVNGPNGPRSNGGIGGFTDWYIPAMNELAILYFFLKPTTDANNTNSGSNPNSVAPYTPNTTYSAGFPNQTTSILFQTGGAQAFSTASGYWSSTQNQFNTFGAGLRLFDSGQQDTDLVKTNYRYARAIRRISA